MAITAYFRKLMSHIYSGLIPPDRIQAVEAALHTAFQGYAVDQIELITGGLSGAAVYRMTVNGQPYMLKLSQPQESGADALSAILHRTSEAGIAPPLHYHNMETGISVSSFIAGRPVQAAMTPEQAIVALGRNIRLLHGLPCDKKGPGLSATIDGMIAAFRQSGLLKDATIEEGWLHYGKIRQVYPWTDADAVLSHNDLNPGNILCDGTRLWMIDWDTASLNDRFVDLAAAANFFAHTEALEQLLLRTYFEREPTAAEHARFFLMRLVSRLIYGMLLTQAAARAMPEGQLPDPHMEGSTMGRFMELIKAGKLSMSTAEGQLFYAKANFNEAFHHMRTDRFGKSLTVLEALQASSPA